MKKALIFGITGQDGSYLAELLLEKGYEVHGIIRRSSSFNTGRIDHILDKLQLHYGDITDPLSVANVISKIKPHEIYNLAAQSHVKVSFEIPYYTGQVDALGTMAILEAIRAHSPGSKFYQASTSELYGGMSYNRPESGYNEQSPFHPRSPYGVSKIYGFWAVKNYREAYGLFACNGILFNHECISENTPLITRSKKTNLIFINRIKDIKKPRNKGKNKQQWILNDIQIWDGESFVDITTITATKRNKEDVDHRCKIINTRHSVVETTNHHNLIDFCGNKIKASEVVIGDKMLHKEYPQVEGCCAVSNEEAMFLGMMVGDGCIGDEGKGQFTNNNPDFIKKIDTLWLKLAQGYTTVKKYKKTEKSYGESTQVRLNGGVKYLDYIRPQIYTSDGFKKIPDKIINSSKEVQEQFLRGYNYADGLKSNPCTYEFKNFKTNSNVLALGLIFLIKNTTKQDFNITFEEDEEYYGYYSINFLSPSKLEKKAEIEELVLVGESQRYISKKTNTSRKTISLISKNKEVFQDSHLSKDKDEVKKIIYHEKQPEWVFDIETTSGVFMAGVGNQVISNSPRRGGTFVTKKVVNNMVDVSLNKRDVLKIGNLESKRDWGYAKEFVEGMWSMLQQDSPEDFVLATGEVHTVRELVELTGKILGYDIYWKGEGVSEKGYDKNTHKLIIEVDPTYYRPSEVDFLLGDPSLAKEKLGWVPKTKFEDLIKIMVDEEIKNYGK